MKHYIKVAWLVFIVMTNLSIEAQIKDINQLEKMAQYIGTWYSTNNIEDHKLSENPTIKMIVVPKINLNNGLQVEVFEKRNNRWETILVELISYDKTSGLIVANGINDKNESFIGKGQFYEGDKWVMEDKNVLGESIMTVSFQFVNSTEVILKGTNPLGEMLWNVKYIKQNPKDKNIGIQLVSVKDEMNENPEETLIQLGRMGYSYIETFVYEKGSFYDQSPEQFSAMVEKAGMKFLGSMTFFDPEDKNDDTAINTWWTKTIQDHKIAGVEYLSTSNSKIKSIKTIKELQDYCNYYNKVGKLCKDNGLKFIFHNHADEFLMVEGVRVYDYFLQNTDPEYVYFQSDIYWMHVAGVNPVDYFKNYSNRFISWHVKDYKELGQSGKINFKDIFKYQKLAGAQYIISEVEDYSFPPLFSVGLAWEYIYYELLK
jgi:sugar phosphate isomerase/epimerase